MTQPKFSLHALSEFLDGSAPLDGVWFGESHPTEAGAFWWRKHLRAAMSDHRTPSNELAERIVVRVYDGDKEITREVFGAEYGERLP